MEPPKLPSSLVTSFELAQFHPGITDNFNFKLGLTKGLTEYVGKHGTQAKQVLANTISKLKQKSVVCALVRCTCEGYWSFEDVERIILVVSG